MNKILFPLLALASFFFASAAHAEHPWASPHATVLPTGDLEYAPQPFSFVAGESVRYIDFEGGNDNADGTRAAPWKHHPWDADASGNAKAAASGVHTYVFKGGVTYRGALKVPDSAAGTSAEPIRLTRDPAWGDGPAVVNGAEVVTGWTRKAHPAMPDGDKVWSAEVDFLPRNLWTTDEDRSADRLKLARWPNWQVSDPLDHMAEWPTWDNPQWWTENNKVTVKGKQRHIGIDDGLPEPLSDLKDATVWTEWGIVMGSPYPTYVDAVIEDKNGLAFTDTWAPAAGNQIITGNRYYLENLPKFLDEPGEYWVEKTGPDSARIYLRLPGDADPNTTTVEAARHYNLIEAHRLEHVHISGLTFRFGNLGWDYNNFTWAADHLEPAAIKLSGEGDGIVIAHNAFEHIHMPIRIAVGSPGQRIGTVSITDNHLRDTDHGAIWVENAGPRGSAEMGHLEYVELLRNKLDDIGFRISRGGHGHAVTVNYPQHSQIAGNFLHRIAGWGIAAYGGKGSGKQDYTQTLTRNLIHHNRVEDVLLASNDWGGIETWQGGSHYIFNNVVINARAFKNWKFKPGSDGTAAFGHAYYMDGSFKNYLFNNIGLGVNNELGTKGVNATAIQNIISFENWYFNNSFHKFAAATRQQQPNAGRRYFLGNIFSDTSLMLFRHANPKDVAPDPNAEHYTQDGAFFYDTIAYAGNVIYDLVGRFGTFEETGVVYDEIQDFSEALQKAGAMAYGVGVVADQAPLQDPDAMNWKPAASSAADEIDITVFVPWSLARPVGEWQFALNRKNPAEVVDEHWFMHTEYDQRQNYYKETTRYPLVGHGIDADAYVDGPLANWTKTALRLDGTGQYLAIAADSLPERGGESAPKRETADSNDGITETKLPFGTLRHPAAVTPGDSYKIYVDLDQSYKGQQLGMHMHWLKSGGWGGFSGVTFPHKLSPTRYIIDVKVKEHAGAVGYNWLPYLSPDGNWNNKTQSATVSIDIAYDNADTEDAPQGPWSVNILESNLLVDLHLKTDDADGTIISKMKDGVGYELVLAGGELLFRVGSDNGATASVAIADGGIADGEWHHILAELDRDNGRLNLFVDGDGPSASVDLGKFTGSLGNDADFLVGGGPGQEPLAATFDFLRVAAASLAESRTTAAEIHAWQFDGPQYHDFTGHDRRSRNAAGALVE